MNVTVLLAVVSGVLTYVLGQFALELVIESVYETKRTIEQISHSLIAYAHVINSPGFASQELLNETSEHLRKLSSQLIGHLYLVPQYDLTAWVFRLPSRDKMLLATGELIGLANNVFRSGDKTQERIDKRIKNIRDSLGIYST